MSTVPAPLPDDPVGQCPICSKMVALHHLELHASGCGMPAEYREDRRGIDVDESDEDMGLFDDDDDDEDTRAYPTAPPRPGFAPPRHAAPQAHHRYGGHHQAAPQPQPRQQVQEATGQCPICTRDYPLWLLERHVNACVDQVAVEVVLYPCGLCKAELALEEMFVLDECSHKFCRKCIAKHAVKGVYNSLTALCPQCEAPLSQRDLQLLLPPKHEIDLKNVNPRKRLMAELKYLKSQDNSKNGFDVYPHEDNLFLWEVRLFGFDPTTDRIAADLNRAGHTYVTLQIKFPADYPRGPPYIRVIRPRFQFMTGHITRGGSVCTELLTNQGWSPSNTVETAIIYVRNNLVQGGARLDPANTHDYTEKEANEAFQRMLSAHGWN